MTLNKNLWILPTDKPSRLAYDFDKLILNSRLLSPILYKTQNIYITNDEEIKEGDWYVNTFVSKREQKPQTHTEKKQLINHQKDYRFKYCKKIILTTDPKLIEDGIQTIEDEFLEWFVKNSSCEGVEANKSYSGTYYIAFPYKIIIPKEEPKQHVEIIMSKCYDNPDYDDLGSDIQNTWEQHVELINDNIEEFDKSMKFFKQETFEETAERYTNESFIPMRNSDGEPLRIPLGQSVPCGFTKHKKVATKHFIRGAKWQQERSYSEEEVNSITQQLRLELKAGVLKWQDDFEFDFDEWFKQFKKK